MLLEISAQLADELPVGPDRCRVHPRLLRESGRQLRRVVYEPYDTGAVEAPGERELVVVYGLAVAREPRDDDRSPAVRQRRHHGADTRVCNYDTRSAQKGHELVERQIVDTGRSGRAYERWAVLDHELLAGREPVDALEETVEPSLVRADGDEDHRSVNTFPAKRERRRTCSISGHWT